MRNAPHGKKDVLFCSPRAPFEFPDFGHICGDTACVLAFARAIATLRLGSVVVLRHVRLLYFYFFSVAEMRLDRKGYRRNEEGEGSLCGSGTMIFRDEKVRFG